MLKKPKGPWRGPVWQRAATWRLEARKTATELMELNAKRRTLRNAPRIADLAAEVAQLRRAVFALIREMKMRGSR